MIKERKLNPYEIGINVFIIMVRIKGVVDKFLKSELIEPIEVQEIIITIKVGDPFPNRFI